MQLHRDADSHKLLFTRYLSVAAVEIRPDGTEQLAGFVVSCIATLQTFSDAVSALACPSNWLRAWILEHSAGAWAGTAAGNACSKAWSPSTRPTSPQPTPRPLFGASLCPAQHNLCRQPNMYLHLCCRATSRGHFHLCHWVDPMGWAASFLWASYPRTWPSTSACS